MSDYKLLCKHKVLRRHIPIINHCVKSNRKPIRVKGRKEGET